MTDSANAARTARPAPRPPANRNVFARIALFVRQVVAELKKVVRPSRSELLTFTAVVIVFVLAVMLYVGLLDFGIGRLILWVFGRDTD